MSEDPARMALLLELTPSPRVHIANETVHTVEPVPASLHSFESGVKQEDQDVCATEGMEMVKDDHESQGAMEPENVGVSFSEFLDVQSLLNLPRHSSVSLLELRKHAKYVKQRAAYVIQVPLALLSLLDAIRDSLHWACRKLKRPVDAGTDTIVCVVVVMKT